MNREEQSVSGMGLSCRLTAEDFKEALRARARASSAAPRQRTIMLVCGSVALVSGIMALLTGGSLPMPMMVGIVVFGVLRSCL
ncbi:hypothetical protein ACFPFX_34965 [Streptomyces mauvecolor]|uniref:Uncharacterized protein n=1 Tax=Streptomyces mauvecolor TaxID=58345 RepID=A0ABV9UY04_9ACTN